MKGMSILPVAVALTILLALSAGLGAAQGPAPQGPGSPQAMVGSAFTYQGQLLKDGSPVNATCSMVFTLYDDAAGNPVGNPITLTVSVANGLFTAPLDFGADLFTGDARWLEVAVQCPGDAGFSTLAPRQALTAAPYALSLQPGAHVAGVVDYDAGLHVTNNSTNSDAVGLRGQSESPQFGIGVFGLASAASGITTGVRGETDSTQGYGVVGRADAFSGMTHGVYGAANSDGGIGVYGSAPSTGTVGIANATGGTTYGVYGLAQSVSGRGVYGEATDGTGLTYGVYGLARSTHGSGVYGYASASSGGTFGVYGLSDSTGGRGLYGVARATSGTTYGVHGRSESTGGRGVWGQAIATSGVTYGVFGSTSSTDGYGVYYVGGLGGTGLKASLVEAQGYGWRQLYSVESPDVLFEDVGSAQLLDGQALVPIDPIFAQTVNLEKPYQVFLTPMGDCGLYVSDQTAAFFAVRALDGRTCSLTFHYRIVAKRLGYEDVRLAPAADPAALDPALQSPASPRERP